MAAVGPGAPRRVAQAMNTAWLGRPLRRAFWFLVAAAALAAPAHAQVADQDPPGRVGRMADLRGGVSWFDAERGQWDDAERNRPLTSGDRISTGPQGRAELRVGSTVLRLAGSSELEMLRIDDERLVFQLHAGSLALRIKSREKAEEIEVVTREVRIAPVRAGHYRFDRIDDSTWAGSWRGDLRIEDPFGFVISTGQRVELWREGSSRSGAGAGSRSGTGELRHAWGNLPDDDFAGRVIAEDRLDDQRSVATRYVSPEMTGAEELDRFGRWDRHPEHGAIWYPVDVRAGWAPYRHGRWAWVRPWGWTWVDEAPWGFAPFHYGRWVFWNSRWGWCPGAYVPRPVFAPALVAWIGGPRLSVSVQIGGPPVGWVPLAPKEHFHPYYRHTPRYVDRVNHAPLLPRPGHGPGHGQPRPQPAEPVMYSNQGVPGAVTVVPRDALLQRQPVGRVAVAPEAVRDVAQTPFVHAPPPMVVSPGSMGPPRPAAHSPVLPLPPAASPPAPAPAPIVREPERMPPAGMPMSAPERAMERHRERPAERQFERPVERPIDRNTERNGEHRAHPWPRRGQEPPAQQAAPQAQAPAPLQVSPPRAPAPAPMAAPPQPRAAEPERPREVRRPPPPDDERKRTPDSRGGARERDAAR
jgi:hypothetical protein